MKEIHFQLLILSPPKRTWGVKMKKFWTWKPSEKLVAAGFMMILAITLIPLLRLALYAVPWYDDYMYGLYMKRAVESGGGLLDMIRAACESARVEWHAWQGTFSSIFLMTFMPAAWGEQYYFIGPVFLILLLVLGVFALVQVLARDVCGFDRVSVLSMQAAVSAMVLMFIYTAQEGFYWYNGGVHYVGMHSFLLILIAMAVKLLKTEKRVLSVFLVPGTALLALLPAGSNYVTALQGLLALLLVAGVGALVRNRRTFLLIPSLLVYGVGFFKNVTAPGNDKRMGFFTDWGYGPVESVLRSFWEAFLHLGKFSGLITIVVLVLFAPMIWRAVKKSRFSFPVPALVLAASVCLYASGFTPSLFSLGHAGMSRALNSVKITYQLLLVINEVYWMGYLCRRLEKKGRKVPEGLCVWWFYPIVGAVMLLIFSSASNQAGNYSAYGAYYYVHTGEAYNFYHEYLERVEKLKGDEPNVEVQAYVFRPWFLCKGDWAESADGDVNRVVAIWYDKDTVVCVPRE